MQYRKKCSCPAMEEIASQMDSVSMTRPQLAELLNNDWAYILEKLERKSFCKEDMDALFASASAPHGSTVSMMRWSLGMRGIPHPEKWIVYKDER